MSALASAAELTQLLDRYQGRITSPGVTEDSGGRFDIPLIVGDVEIACVNLRASGVQLYHNTAGDLCGLAMNGDAVALP